MKTFAEWLLKREMLQEPFPALSTPQRAGLGLLNAMPSGTAKLPKWKRNLTKPKGSEDGKWK